MEFRGTIIEAGEGVFCLGYRNPRQRWERVGFDPKLARDAAEKKRAELASIATGREERPREIGQVGMRISLPDASDLYLSEIRCTRAKHTVALFTQTLTEFTVWMGKQFPSVRLMNEIRRSHMLGYYDVLQRTGLSVRHGEKHIQTEVCFDDHEEDRGSR